MHDFVSRGRSWSRAMLAGIAVGVTAVAAGAAAAPGEPEAARAVFRFDESVERSERDAPDAVGAVEKYQRHGLLLVEAGGAAGPGVLTLTEFEAPKEKTEPPFSFLRADLAQADETARESRQLEWGWPSMPTEVLADPDGNGPTLAGAPLPFHAVALPGVLPMARTTGKGEGEVVLSIAWGAAVFTLRCRVEPDAEHPGWQRIRLDETPVQFRGQRQVLVLRATGCWRLRPGQPGSSLPDESAGSFALRLHTRTVRDGTVVEPEISAAIVDFRFVRLTGARFDGERVSCDPPGSHEAVPGK